MTIIKGIIEHVGTIEDYTVRYQVAEKLIKEHEYRVISELRNIVNDFVIMMYEDNDMYLTECYEHDVTINGRLTRAGGRYCYGQSWYGDIVNQVIEMSKETLCSLIVVNDYDTIKSVMEHEALHYVLHTNDYDFKDGEPTFVYYCQKYNIVQSLNPNYDYMHRYECGDGCEARHSKSRRLNLKLGYKCTRCKSELTYKGRTFRIYKERD